ncbi:unnamed protein product [Staurois parvus]|uniref:Uncharacterized protein n=1 Tax=Staurois parvus TaxID=386267 RepID=A0ABN9D4S4_9NEOB|nr:unnamed protein product [Staurois parvus]
MRSWRAVSGGGTPAAVGRGWTSTIRAHGSVCALYSPGTAAAWGLSTAATTNP